MLTATIRPRIDDLGPVGHIHNTVLPAWFQQARQELLDAFQDPQAVLLAPLMIKEYTVTFHRELVLAPDVEVTIEVERIGNSSFSLHEQAFQSGHLSAESRVVYIYVGSDGRPAPIPEDRKALLLQHKSVGE
ncbi:MAG: acyl-CoA thioesterase [Yaniella sp.]|uniref:acyl-CoA thioesterase n=1 Tax=Yaniella sp. TaxID=2773929 RepID=UPI0026472943|nr:thioesterase family protein [Yaniella sp.]MDN5704803.1 acyl-CoA thioesterase [Yaniella sp.]MDN5731773.1 acyl-CoA thioesterase [Yaniella sp.]MDN5743395.1 acyl-CoA thioesterase [Yaniella sp.]MDN5814906.1 acyl-CoA thioesterase [Yaniella sp.]MDN5817434.1 acyl-CoA thioesterase [Yaniella sp.]